MTYASDTGFRAAGPGEGRNAATTRMPRAAWALVLACLLALALPLALTGCSTTKPNGSGNSGGAGGAGGSKPGPNDETLLLSRKGDTSIQVTESNESGNQMIRVHTVFRGEENTILLNVDQPTYEIEIPLSLDQVIPQAASSAVRGPEGQFQDMLVNQYLERAQQAMMNGDYNGALRQVNLVLNVQPNHIQAHAMKGSIYYALGNYQLANDEWEEVLAIDPSNTEVREFQSFLKNRQGGAPPPAPGKEQGAGKNGKPPLPPANQGAKP